MQKLVGAASISECDVHNTWSLPNLPDCTALSPKPSSSSMFAWSLRHTLGGIRTGISRMTPKQSENHSIFQVWQVFSPPEPRAQMDQMSSHVECVEPQDSPHRSGWHHPVGSVMIPPCRAVDTLWLVVFRHPEKWWSESQLGWHSQYMESHKSHKSHVPNHQPVLILLILRKFHVTCERSTFPRAHSSIRISRGVLVGFFAFTTCRASVSDPLTSPPASASKQNDAANNNPIIERNAIETLGHEVSIGKPCLHNFHSQNLTNQNVQSLWAATARLFELRAGKLKMYLDVPQIQPGRAIEKDFRSGPWKKTIALVCAPMRCWHVSHWFFNSPNYHPLSSIIIHYHNQKAYHTIS